MLAKLRIAPRWSVYVVLPLLVYLVVVLAVTWPLVTQLSTSIIGNSVADSDAVEHLRMIWWVKYALQHGLNPFYQSYFGYPSGFFSAIQWSQPLVYWPASLLSFILTPIASFNLWALVVLILNGITAYWLCLDVLGQTENPGESIPIILAALLGGLIFMIFPTVQGHLFASHVNVVSNYSLPILILCLYRIINGRGTRRIALLGAVAFWVLLLSNYTGLFALIIPLIVFGGGYVLVFKLRNLFNDQWRGIKQLAMVFGGGALLSIPFYAPLAADAFNPVQSAYLKLASAGWILYSADLLSFVSLSPFTPWTKPFAPAYSYNVLNANLIEGSAYLGIIAVGLAILAVIARRKSVGLWLTLALGSMVFALGPILKWKEQPVVYTLGLDKSNVVLPWALFQNLPLINLIRTPGRFNFMTGLALGLLAAYGLYIILHRLNRTAWRVVLCGVLMIGVMAEYQVKFPFGVFSRAEPDYFYQLANRADMRAVFDVPYMNTTKDALYEQMAHQKPIPAGYYARLTQADITQLMLLSDVARGLAWTADSNTTTFPGQALTADDVRSVLKAHGIDVLVYHWNLLDKATTLPWATATFGPPTYQDGDIAVFEVPAPAAPSERLVVTHQWQYLWPYSEPGEGWYPDVEDRLRKVGQAPDSLWLKGGARLLAYTPNRVLQRFTFTLDPLFRAHTISFNLDGHPLYDGTIGPAPTTLDFWAVLQPGVHTLAFTVNDGCTPLPVPPACLQNGITPTTADNACTAPGVCLSANLTRLQIDQSSAPFQTANVQLGEGMRLQGFQFTTPLKRGQNLIVATDWLAAQRLPGDYHLFIHVLDQNGTPIAQFDGIPGNGLYPTTKWSAPQQWSEVTALPIPDNAPAGTYEVYAGWYAYPNLARLSVSSGKRAADGLVYLGTVDIR